MEKHFGSCQQTESGVGESNRAASSLRSTVPNSLWLKLDGEVYTLSGQCYVTTTAEGGKALHPKREPLEFS